MIDIERTSIINFGDTQLNKNSEEEMKNEKLSTLTWIYTKHKFKSGKTSMNVRIPHKNISKTPVAMQSACIAQRCIWWHITCR